jgi:hypothetical protein
MKIKDFIDKMTEEELQSFKEKKSDFDWFLDVFGDRRIESQYMEKKELDGYDVYDNDAFTVIIKDGKLVHVLNQSESWGSEYFDGVIILLGHDAMSMFSTRTEEASSVFIR